MNPLGASTWIWTACLDDRRLRHVAGAVAALGFDVLELPLHNPGDWDPGLAHEVLAEHRLRAAVCAVTTADRSLVEADDVRAAATARYLRACVDAAARVHSPVVAGPVYAPTATGPQAPGERDRLLLRLAERLKPLADHAMTRGVTLAIEPVNRYESSLVNTVEQAVAVVDLVGAPGLAVTLDTFHMNIEEADVAAAVAAAGSCVAHVQVSGNDRGAPGRGHFPWAPFLAALLETGYAGAFCIEAFASENAVASVRRRLAAGPEILAADGLDFLRSALLRAGAGRLRAPSPA